MIPQGTVDMAIIVLTRAVLDVNAGRDASRWTKHLAAILRETAPKEAKEEP
jgi:hypothetical protein